MNRPALIYASGSAKRWARCGEGADIPADGTVKQLLPVEGVPVICRTVKQCLDRGLRPIIVTPHKPIREAVWTEFTDLCIAHAVDFLDVGSPDLLVETISLSQASMTDGVQVGLLGDVFYSDDCMDKIAASDDLMYFGRRSRSAITGGCPELFAWTWRRPEHQSQMDKAIGAAIVEADENTGSRSEAGTPYGGLWQLYRGSIGIPLDSPETVDRFVNVYDFTDDFDTPDEYARWRPLYARRMIKQEKHIVD